MPKTAPPPAGPRDGSASALTETQVADGSELSPAMVRRILRRHALPAQDGGPTLYPADTLYRAQCARHMLEVGIVPRAIALALSDATKPCGPDDVAVLAGYAAEHAEKVAAEATVPNNDARVFRLPDLCRTGQPAANRRQRRQR